MSSDLMALQLGYNLYTFNKNVDGISHQESLAAPAAGGNCLNWVVGHLAVSRDMTRQVLGLPASLNEAQGAAYQRSSEPLTDASKAASFAKLVDAFAGDQEAILSAMDALTAEQLAAPAPFSPAKNPDETVGTLLAGLIFHEAYHIGQTGVLRHIAGHDGVLT